MSSDITALKEMASRMFTPDMALEIRESIDHESRDAPVFSPSPLGVDRTPSLSLWPPQTLWDNLGSGHFSGWLPVYWNGMDQFVYVPDEHRPLIYTTSEGTAIQPGPMHTDGGSIPRILRGFSQFSSWGYAPAFIIHDWLFTAKKCRHDVPTELTLDNAARIMAEAMKSMMVAGFFNYQGLLIKLDEARTILYLMYQAVRTDAAEAIWDDDASVTCLA